MPPKPVKESWQNSKGKELLMKDLRSGKVAIKGKGDAIAVYNSRVEFGGNNIDNQKKFPQRLRAARQKTVELNERSAFDVDAIAHDRVVFPINATNHLNEPRWEGSDAQIFLRNDVSSKLHQNMKPQELHRLRAAYLKFSLKTFREHIYQEDKRQKYIRDKYNHHRKT